MAETTIAILTHNRSWHFAQCIASIRRFTRGKYIIKVLDNNSDAEHVEHMKQYKDRDCSFIWGDKFLSCLEGRRQILNHINTEYVAFIDDDIRVGPAWLECMLRPMENDPDAGAVAANIIQEGIKVMSGVRYLARPGSNDYVAPLPIGREGRVVRHFPVNHEGQAPLSCGGATLYRLDVLRDTEFRPEFNGGYEDWDQTLQITQDLKKNIYGSRATVFHKHMNECKDYFSDRWRWRELTDSALGMWDRWRVRTAVDKVLRYYLEKEIVIPADQAARITEALK